MTCRTCRHFMPQWTKTGRVKHAPGRCTYPLPELPPVPNTVDREGLGHIWKHRYAAWPDHGKDCPTWEALA